MPLIADVVGDEDWHSKPDGPRALGGLTALALVAAFALPAAAGIVPNPANDPSLIDQPLED